MRKLPQTSAEAFTGMQRCFDLYVITVLFSFAARMDIKDLFEKPRMHPVLYAYVSTARESLKDWLSNEVCSFIFARGGPGCPVVTKRKLITGYSLSPSSSN